MTAANFPLWLTEILRHEGGYVDHPSDPGGATNMGITHKTLAAWRGKPVTKDDVRRLGMAEVGAIYKANYWDAVQGDALPSGLDLVAFDAAVNSGVSRGAKWLQAALYVTADGKIGPKTVAAAHSANRKDAIIRACEARMDFLRGLKTWPTFGKGWARRVDGIRITALQAASETDGRIAATQKPAGGVKPVPAPAQAKKPQSPLAVAVALAIAAVAAIYAWFMKG